MFGLPCTYIYISLQWLFKFSSIFALHIASSKFERKLWISPHNINRAHQYPAQLFKFDAIVYLSQPILLVLILWRYGLSHHHFGNHPINEMQLTYSRAWTMALSVTWSRFSRVSISYWHLQTLLSVCEVRQLSLHPAEAGNPDCRSSVKRGQLCKVVHKIKL